MPEYKVHYFHFTGRAEPIRMLLRYGGIPFTDNRIRFEDWPKTKQSMPLEQLPALEIEGDLIPQSVAICRYLAKIVQLDGRDERENLKIDISVETLSDLLRKLVDYAHEKTMKTESAENFVNETLPYFLSRLEQQAMKNRGYIALNRLTWADIIFVCLYEDAANFVERDIIADYPNLLEVRKNVLAVSAIREWIQIRPENQINTFYNLKADL
ncbi:unnamed protein product [Phaedon cochleariae]|uniref:glutathione transferase n=1 Tax=Phaedon cochleariae TaxID=80249 RepID=A0A9P0DKM9_PHACE|nr:unnamed protein product [Phaedon cochleariae]